MTEKEKRERRKKIQERHARAKKQLCQISERKF